MKKEAKISIHTTVGSKLDRFIEKAKADKHEFIQKVKSGEFKKEQQKGRKITSFSQI